MNIVEWTLIAAFVTAILLYFKERRRNQLFRKELAYIHQKLDEWTAPHTASITQERLLMMTEDPAMRELLQTVNALLDRAGQTAADYVRSQQAMRTMLSNVSHDLKTPLTVIMGYAEMLVENRHMPEEERQRMIGQVYRKTVEVHELINAFFDLSRLEADDYGLSISPIDVSEVCRHRVLSYFDLLSEQGFHVDIRLPEHPVWVDANEEALARIIDNLLSNAVRYGADGRYLGFMLTDSEEQIRIDVIDRGRGIDLKDQAMIFERMYTLDDSRNRSMQGSGLGLAITKRLTERLGGTIRLDSKPGVQTCFSIMFPRSPLRSFERKN